MATVRKVKVYWRKYPILYHKSHKVIWRKTPIVFLQKSRKPKFVFSFYVFLFHVFALFLFKNKSIKGYYIFFDLFIVIHYFSKENKFHESKLCSDKNDVIRVSFQVRSYSYLITFKRFSCSSGYTHLNALIRLVETTL